MSILQDGQAISASRRRMMLFMLCFIYMLNYLDRQIVVILQEPIKAEFQLQDWHLGLLTGAAFGFFYTIMGVPIAHRVDRGGSRIRLIGGLLSLWSLMTAVCGVTVNYLQFFVARMMVGLAESGFTPASHALLSDLYPAKDRPRAMAVLSIGVPIGVMAGLSIGGLVAHFANWRIALFAAGAPGLVAAGIFWYFAREPMRGAMEAAVDSARKKVEPIPLAAAIRTFAACRPFVHVIIATAVTTFVEIAMMSWMPSFIIRTYGLPLSEVGPAMGLIAGAGGVLGTLIGGWQANWFGRNGMHGMLWVPILGLLACIPLYIAVLMVGDGYTALLLLVLPTITGGFWTAPAIALTQNLVPVATRARAAAVRIVAANLLGITFGPLALGLMSDGFARVSGDASLGLRNALICFTLLFAWAAVQWLFALRSLARTYPSTPDVT